MKALFIFQRRALPKSLGHSLTSGIVGSVAVVLGLEAVDSDAGEALRESVEHRALEDCAPRSCLSDDVIDLNGHTIANVESCAFRLFGDFTIQNGTITSVGDSYALLINSNNTTSGVDYKPDTRENHKVTVDGLTLVEGGLRAELSTITVTNCDIQNSGESGQSNCLYFVGVVAKVTDCKLNQTANAIETISRTNCVYCSGNSSLRLTNLTLEGTKRLNAYKNTISYRIENCPGWVTTTPEVVK